MSDVGRRRASVRPANGDDVEAVFEMSAMMAVSFTVDR
jgi:hypothetical protein